MTTLSWEEWASALPGIEIQENEEDSEEKLVRISGLANPFEAAILSRALQDEHIPHSIERHEDTAYGSLFEITRSWGSVVLHAGDAEHALSILLEIRTHFTPDEDTPGAP